MAICMDCWAEMEFVGTLKFFAQVLTINLFGMIHLSALSK